MFKSMILSAALFLGVAAHAQVPVIKIDGSSTVFPITEAMAEEFQTAQKGKVRVTVGISGTGGGFKKFCRGEIDVQNASRPIQTAELEACRKTSVKFIELPIAYDATAVVVNPKNTWLKSITVAELKKMWEPAAQGKVMTWADVNPAWPKEKLKLYGAGSDSGTFDYFTEAVVGKSKSSRGDYTASEDDNTLVTGVSTDLYALGYVPLAYAAENKAKLKVVPVVGGDKAPKKEAIMPSRETVEAGTYFPLSRPVFIYVSEASMKKAEIKDFVNFYLSNCATIVPEVKYVPLPAKAYETGKAHVKNNKLGTVFGGHSEVGLKIDQLMKREGSL
ncbi:PstS family phosphate ABC transporter substrate-binding protein [Bdellovibrio reynosensis]|uniref:Phosphate-binding protein n=1 Tax=Bdellovibrio reynosensis TaxID=2835041 RepID=A0ABY4CBC0_9BACT|nr:PstS family phosphate ABC transporter substrate-binding protein [Bdellovibrio reynosensis]UOF02272.1 PstS family phosphate ABC transporter substrate-binding protein [Bdellovibrio reynosensis]